MSKIRNFVKHRKHKLVNSVVFAGLFMLLPLMLNSFSEVVSRVTPHTYWFHYEKVVVVPETAYAGEYPRFTSFAEIKRPVAISWNDILRCSLDGTDYFYRSYQTSYTYLEPTLTPTTKFNEKTGDESLSSWAYGFPLPETPGETCYLQTIVTGRLPNGVEKVQKLEGERFLILNRE